jgi:hypothetical protein
MFPRTSSLLRTGGAERSDAWNQGKYAKAFGSFVGDSAKLPFKIADDVIGGFGRGAYRTLRNPVEDAGRAALGLEDRKEPSAAPESSPATAQPANSPVDATVPGKAPGRATLRGRSGADVAGAPGVSKFKENGRTLYTNVTGDNADMMDKKLVSIVPGMNREAVDQTLTNPNGSRWSAQDNAIMAANLRDGVDPTRGTSGGQMGGVTIIGSPAGGGGQQDRFSAPSIDTKGLSQRQKAQYTIAAAEAQTRRMAAEYGNDDSLRQDGTTRRGQDVAASTTLRGQNQTRAANAARAQQEQANKDRAYQLDVARFGV